ncbi:MAG: hypothetical protein QOE79_839 [Sphingomonadales bacterium]|jgi:hypothetical protein|nr:hypothetical protein [Sphingomonadales bacterium]MEA3048348.1 hypothetical protein [Sphingomonadales bacterium]
MRAWFPLFLLAPLAACDTRPPPAPDAPVPPQLCAEAKKGLDALARNGGFDYDDKGEASALEAAWLQMKAEQRDQLVKLLAYHASCVAGAQNDAQNVVIRSEQGEPLTSRSVSTRVEAGAALGTGEDTAR